MRTALLTTGVMALATLSIALPFAPVAELAGRDPDILAIILFELRVPRALIALSYGAVLGLTGAAIQGLFGNPLASPDLTGTSGGAALGAVCVTYLFGLASPWAFAAGGIGGAALALAALPALAGPRADSATLLLAGLALTAVTGALTSLALALAPSPFAFYDAFDWLLGSLVDRSLPQAALAVAALVVAAALLLPLRPALDALALGEEVAQAGGHRLAPLRGRVILATALGVGGCVAVAGAIGFIGLVAPVLARPLVGHRPGRAMLPAALIGAGLLLAADLLTRLAPLGRPLPVGVVTAILGAPFFLRLVIAQRWRTA